MKFFLEIAKMRAARGLWAGFMERLGATNPKSLALRTHCQTSGWSLTAQAVETNVVRTCIEAMAATQGGTQSLHTNSFDEALALPSDESARVARNTQIFLQQTSGTCHAIDPWGGSHYVEHLTYDVAKRALVLIDEVEEAGGMTKAIEKGIPQQRIEAAAAATQARIDSGAQTIVGLNKYPEEIVSPKNLLKVNNSAVIGAQTDRLQRLREERDSQEVEQKLHAITRIAEGKKGNLLEACVQAARAKASVGEMSLAMEKVWGRHKAKVSTAKNIYQKNFADTDMLEQQRKIIEQLTQRLGRAPKIYIAKIGQDGHDRGQKVVASAYRDFGWEVTAGVLFQTPQEAVASAIEEQADVLAINSLAAGHLGLVPQVQSEIKNTNANMILIVGGVIPPDDFDAVYKAGAQAIFPPGTNLPKASQKLAEMVNQHYGHNQPLQI